MKRMILSVVSLQWLLMCPTASAAELSTERQKLSYAMGVLVADNVQKQAIDIETEIFLQAMGDVLDQKELQLTPEEIRMIIEQYQKQETESREMSSENNKEKGEAFLAKNSKEEGITTLENGLQYEVITQGDGAKPSADSTVKVHYRGTLIDGTEFDSSYSRGTPAEFKLNQVIQGWQEILPLMQIGSKWKIFVPSELAYGERGAGQLITPNAALIFEIELLEIK